MTIVNLCVNFKMPEPKKRNFPRRPKCFYPLSEVREKIHAGKVFIQENARSDASRDFGWGTVDILNIYNKLTEKHFYKTGQSTMAMSLVVDIYKAYLNGEDIYTHFYIDDSNGILVINSFKRQ